VGENQATICGDGGPVAGGHRRVGGRPRASGDGGAALVEFALVLPFLAILAFGTIDLGRAYQLRNRVTNAAREGAFYGQFHPCDTTGIQQAADDEDPGLSTISGYSVTSTSPCPASGSDLTVTVSANMTILAPLVGRITGQTVTVAGRSTVVVQG
jgi:Flp pilus assembly protein TadG